MGKSLFIAEKPSVAREFANALKVNTTSRDGYLESADTIITWCVGHLVTMSYPDAYDEKLKTPSPSFQKNINMRSSTAPKSNILL